MLELLYDEGTNLGVRHEQGKAGLKSYADESRWRIEASVLADVAGCMTGSGIAIELGMNVVMEKLVALADGNNYWETYASSPDPWRDSFLRLASERWIFLPSSRDRVEEVCKYTPFFGVLSTGFVFDDRSDLPRTSEHETIVDFINEKKIMTVQPQNEVVHIELFGNAEKVAQTRELLEKSLDRLKFLLTP